MGAESKSLRATYDASQRRDDAVMETNNSCIVSKRSVEKLYRSDEPEFFRYFVKKFQRRSPLINRGYWLRMKAIEHVILSFLNAPSTKHKLVINLGCGYDPLPFRFLSSYPDICQNTTFVDVDFPPLIMRKREIIDNTAPLCETLEDLDTVNPQYPILLRSRRYLALGCDMKRVDGLTNVLEHELHIRESSVLFLAEVAITYMESKDADSVINWASQFDDARFCLLEQHLPSGPNHPFAHTMLEHFKKLQSPLLVLRKYPQIQDQQIRFLQNGWSRVDITDLWSLWSHDDFLKPNERRSLDSIEPFDEWEEFALFGGHYFLLVATSASKDIERSPLFPASLASHISTSLNCHDAKLLYTAYPNGQHYRRFGAAMMIKREEQVPNLVGFHGGMGQKTRLTTCHIHADLNLSDQFKGPPTEARMNHTITRHRDSRYLLVGGRSSPDKAQGSCWLQEDGHWQEVDSLFPGRYRHCAGQVGLQFLVSGAQTRLDGVLTYGGRTSDGNVLGEWMFWDGQNGWQKVQPTNETPEPRFGASMLSLAEANRPCGYVTGGMRSDGTVIEDLWKWELIYEEGLRIVCRNLSSYVDSIESRSIFGRFGAALVMSEWGVLLVGGVTNGLPLRQEDEVLIFEENPKYPELLSLSRLRLEACGPRPLLIGFGATTVQDHSVIVLGGGATCFSFGTYWNAGCYTLTNDEELYNALWHIDKPTLEGLTNKRDKEGSGASTSRKDMVQSGALEKAEEQHRFSLLPAQLPEPVQIRRVSIASKSDFDRLVAQAQPVILEHLPLGPCVAKWEPSYLKEKIGSGRTVIVHSSPSDHMTFQSKNFSYVTMPFEEFMDRVESGERLYLRALSSNKPTKQATNLQEDYPEIATDFHLPSEFSLVHSQMHSSPLRISGPVSMWLHYDVMANVLCQIKGKKRLMLYPPTDVGHFNLAPGASSSEINVFQADGSTHPSLARTHPHEVMLKPGEALYIPALWLHAATPTEGLSIAVNVFFRNLEQGYAIGRDVYGNRDLAAYEKGRQEINKIFKSFSELPQDIRGFYLQRLSDELKILVEDMTR
ncbi:LCM-domain-containing protein [Viridothelium virens]|uniref:tRNA wybutosine-synthesizing protein 4 n=1 Tax=Viridothelium virens TaxID=1048519 RepID=A0A6A6HPQ0_VIRVR|nr:LCM-domain-containing protein [Viridothelium virens]